MEVFLLRGSVSGHQRVFATSSLSQSGRDPPPPPLPTPARVANYRLGNRNLCLIVSHFLLSPVLLPPGAVQVAEVSIALATGDMETVGRLMMQSRRCVMLLLLLLLPPPPPRYLLDLFPRSCT